MNLVNVNGQVKGVEAWKRSPVNQGKLCPKGNFSYEFINHPDRLKTPLIRTDGELYESSWDEALRLIGERLNFIKSEDPDSIAFLGSAKCTNEENYLIQKFARAVIGTNNIDNCANLCHGPSLAGLSLTYGSGAMTNSMDDLIDSDCIFLIGSNIMEQHPIIGRQVLRAKKNGTKLIVVDPRHTSIAQFADLFLPIKPGTDIALVNSMMNIIIREGLEDKEFIDNRTINYDKIETFLKDFKLEEAEFLTGIDAKLIERAAKYYGSSANASIIYCMGITQHTQGTDNVIALSNLAMLTGNLGKRGTGVNPLRGQNNVQGSCDMGVLPYFFPGYQPIALDRNREKIEKIWNCEPLNFLPGLQLTEIMEEVHQGNIKALYIMGENPMISDPNLIHVEEALKNLELLIVQDIFLTKTAAMADFVLPASCWAEKNGTFTSTERRVQRVRKAAPPPGNAREDWKIICDLARCMGSERFNYSTVQDVFQEIREITPQYEGMDNYLVERPGGVQWPCNNENRKGSTILHQKEFKTKDGKGVFIPINLKEPPEIDEGIFLLTTGRIIFQHQTGSMTMRSESLKKEFPNNYLEIHPDDAGQLNISDGEKIKVVTNNGEIEVYANYAPDIRRGVVFMPFHYEPDSGLANILTDGVCNDPVSKIPPLKLCKARLEKIR
jgi:formate dehydrogenase major subunit